MKLNTTRLIIDPMSETNDTDFIFQLLNTDGWIRYIGNRNIHGLEEAKQYIKKINSNRDISYFTVRTREDGNAIGLITIIKRSYLNAPDTGFAFLPVYHGKGYAYEAATAVLNELISNDNTLEEICAVTLPENDSSIRLLKKLGLTYKKTVMPEDLTLDVYGVSIQNFK